MSLHNAFRSPLSMIVEAQNICRHFSTRASLSASQYRYETSGAAGLSLDNQTTSRAKRFDALRSLNPSPRTGGKAILEESNRQAESKDLEKMQTRRWKKGDIYAPHDLSPMEMRKWKQRVQPDRDIFDTLNINPLDEYKNYAMLAEFSTTMGRIKNPRDTGLRRVNQRRVARAIRRAIGMGWLPSVHAHPELLRRRGPS